MDVHEARTVLEVTDGDGWDAVRASYRRLIRGAHPDREGGTTRGGGTRDRGSHAAPPPAPQARTGPPACGRPGPAAARPAPRRQGSPVGTGAKPAGAGRTRA